MNQSSTSAKQRMCHNLQIHNFESYTLSSFKVIDDKALSSRVVRKWMEYTEDLFGLLKAGKENVYPTIK